jgi:hypothetical protein
MNFPSTTDESNNKFVDFKLKIAPFGCSTMKKLPLKRNS